MKCKIENCNNNIWSNGLCRNHSPRKKIKSKVLSREEMTKSYADVLEMRMLFFKLWSIRRPYSEISNVWLGPEPLTIFFHHILPKGEERFEIAALDEENIIILTPDEHTNVESDMYKYPEINKRREYLMLKYNL